MYRHENLEFTHNGQTYYTHTSWLSEKQHNSWLSIPEQNSNLALYYSLSTISVLGIFLRRHALIKNMFTSYGSLLTMGGAGWLSAYVGWMAFYKSGESSEIHEVISKNHCKVTPLWKKPDQVVNLRSKDYASFMNIRNGQKFGKDFVKNYKPAAILTGNEMNETLELLA